MNMREMKDSGIEWIAHIPSNWTTDRMKYLFTNGKGLSITKENLIETGLPVISYGQIHSKSNSGTDIKDELLRFVDFQYQTNYPQCEVFQYDFVFADTSEDYDGCGNCVYKRDSSLLFGGYHAIILHSLVKRDNRYFAYLFKTDSWRKQLREVASGVKLFSITQKVLMNSSVIVPPEDEQKAISDYLDLRCTELDTIISDIQSQIEALEEYKRSVITEAVTKGLDPDVEMRDSGIAWVGDIPAHWSIIPFKYILSERNENNSPVKSNERLSLSIGLGVTLYSEKTTNLDRFKDDVSQYKLAHKGDLVMNSMNVIVGAVGVTNYYGCISPAYYCFYDNEEDHVTAKYCEFIFLSKGMRSVLYHLGKGIMAIDRGDGRVNTCRLKVSKYDINHLLIPFPPVDEQRRIVEYAITITTEVDEIIAEKKQQIETIEEYKKSLIFEYVTGKKEVQA